MESSEQVEKVEEQLPVEADLEDEEDAVIPEQSPVSSPRLKELPGRKFEFKEDSETSAMFNSRLKIVEALKKLRLKTGSITTQEIDMLSRMINNKLWYGVTYSKDDESYINYIINLL